MSNEKRLIEERLAEAERLEEAGLIREAMDCLGSVLSLEETPHLFFQYVLSITGIARAYQRNACD